MTADNRTPDERKPQHLPESVDASAAHIYNLYRDYFVANYLDGDDGGLLSVKASVLADEIADMFSSEHWRETWNHALFASLLVIRPEESDDA